MQHAIGNGRINGLDTLRAFAIIIVLLFHYMVVVTQENTFGYVTRIGWMGVDLFFVLSGYLIGNQLLSALKSREDFSIKTFSIRRLLRTLPNYYFVLALYFIFPTALAGSETASILSFLTFTQNSEFRPGVTFSHSWSLCIEEQFYFIFPTLFLLLAARKHSIILMWASLIIGMITGLAVRLYMLNHYGGSSTNVRDYYQHIYYSSFTRFDELLPGIMIAMIKNFHPTLFQRLQKKSNAILVAGIGMIALAFYAFPHFHSTDEAGFNRVLSTLGYSWIALGFSFLVFAALSTDTLLGRTRIFGAEKIALWSYAIYLIHKPLFKILIEPLTQHTIDVKSILGISIIMGVSVAAGWLLFYCVETPFMKWRDKIYPRNTTKGN